MLEFEEQNIEYLSQTFVNKYKGLWMEFMDEKLIELTQEFIHDRHAEKWAEHVDEEYNNNQIGTAEMYYE